VIQAENASSVATANLDAFGSRFDERHKPLANNFLEAIFAAHFFFEIPRFFFEVARELRELANCLNVVDSNRTKTCIFGKPQVFAECRSK
jgi:hypothetical protein